MQAILPLFTLIIGAFLGFAATLISSWLTHMRTIELRILDQFLEVRKQVVNGVSDLAEMDFQADLGEAVRANHARAVAKIFYQHYDFLPRQVLDALALLQAALAHPDRAPYTLKDNSVVAMDPAEVAAFIDRCSLLANARMSHCLLLNSADIDKRHKAAIRLHARHVLYTMNRFASVEQLSHMIKQLRKNAPDLHRE